MVPLSWRRTTAIVCPSLTLSCVFESWIHDWLVVNMFHWICHRHNGDSQKAAAVAYGLMVMNTWIEPQHWFAWKGATVKCVGRQARWLWLAHGYTYRHPRYLWNWVFFKAYYRYYHFVLLRGRSTPAPVSDILVHVMKHRRFAQQNRWCFCAGLPVNNSEVVSDCEGILSALVQEPRCPKLPPWHTQLKVGSAHPHDLWLNKLWSTYVYISIYIIYIYIHSMEYPHQNMAWNLVLPWPLGEFRSQCLEPQWRQSSKGWPMGLA